MSLIERLKNAQPSLIKRLKYATRQRDRRDNAKGYETPGLREVGRMGNDKVGTDRQTN